MIQMFKDTSGKVSNMRVSSFLCLLYLFFITTYQSVKSEINFEVLVLFATCAFAPKVVQKFAERTS